MAWKWPKSAPHLALTDARHVLDVLPMWLPCTRARPPWPTRIRTPRHTSLPLPLTFGEAQRPPCSLSTLPHSPLLALPLCSAERDRVHHGRRAELAPAASLLPLSPLATHRMNHRLRLFLLYDRRPSSEPETAGTARRSEPLPSPPLAAVAVPPQAATGRAGQTSRCTWDHGTSPPLHHRRRRPQPPKPCASRPSCSAVGEEEAEGPRARIRKKGGGLSEEVVTHVNSAHEDLFAGV